MKLANLQDRITTSVVDEVPQLKRGQVWCVSCGDTFKVNSGNCLSTGWPMCCGQTMTIDSPEERANFRAKGEITMADDKRETTLTNIENLYGRDDHDGAFERAIITAYDAGYAAATAEAQSDGWVAIETVEDLPTEAGRYLWQFRNVDDGIVFDLRIFTPSFARQPFVKAFVAWQRLAPYQRKSEGGIIR